jgi:microcystin-dependent protein
MTDQYLGEVRMFGGNFAPQGWALCSGQLLSIAQNSALFALLGTTYGGDGQSTFGLPDLRGRVPMHQGTGQGLSPRVIGEISGVETVTIVSATMPAHAHGVTATTAVGSLTGPGPTALPGTPTGGSAVNTFYVTTGTSSLVPAPMAATSISVTGQTGPHDNMMPFLCTNFIISLVGIFPTRN